MLKLTQAATIAGFQYPPVYVPEFMVRFFMPASDDVLSVYPAAKTTLHTENSSWHVMETCAEIEQWMDAFCDRMKGHI